ncbi:MAG TPA: hypothetical protein ENN67_05005 [Firmicutes bacterium]|nr:hypothetical protein [Bacillota bacterium]
MNRSILMQTVTNSENIRKSLEYSGKNIVWWRNSDRIDSYGIENTLMSDSETTASLGRMRTRLNRFSETEQKLLINWGYTLCDAAIKKHGGQSGTKINSSPGQLPD